jgi:hypothetical protein
MSECSKKKKATKEIEKRRARAMFGGTSSENTIQKDLTESEKNHKMKGARQQHRKPTVVDKCANVTTAISSAIGRSSSPACKKSVSFSQCPPQVKEFEPFSSSNDDDDQEIHETWISQNKEALIVLAVAGFSTIALITLKKFAR